MELTPITVSLPNPNRVEPGQNQSTTAQSIQTGDTASIHIASMITELLNKTGIRIAEQQALLQSLPPSIQAAAKQIVQTSLPDTATLSTGLTALLASRRGVIDGMNKLADSLHIAAIFPERDSVLQSAVQSFSQKLMAIVSEQSGETSDLITKQNTLEQVRTLMQQSPMLHEASARLSAFKQTAVYSVPHSITHAADKLDMPEIAKLWLLADSERNPWLDEPAQSLEQSAAIVRTLTESISKAFHTIGEDNGQNILFTMQIPFTVDGQLEPVHIHIFHEKPHENPDGSDTQPDTWIKLSLQPEHTGPVEAVFHLYGDNILDIKVNFADKQAAQLFTDELAAIRTACSDYPFLLRDLCVL